MKNITISNRYENIVYKSKKQATLIENHFSKINIYKESKEVVSFEIYYNAVKFITHVESHLSFVQECNKFLQLSTNELCKPPLSDKKEIMEAIISVKNIIKEKQEQIRTLFSLYGKLVPVEIYNKKQIKKEKPLETTQVKYAKQFLKATAELTNFRTANKISVKEVRKCLDYDFPYSKLLEILKLNLCIVESYNDKGTLCVSITESGIKKMKIPSFLLIQ
jgi:hypothetical protein